MKLNRIAAFLALAVFSTTANAQLFLDFQGPNDITAVGYQPFIQTNLTLPDPAGINYSAFGSTVNVAMSTANLPDGAADFRVVARNGASAELVNDWIGVDTRVVGVDVTLTLDVTGLPSGSYNWTSYHHDGGSTANNGNLNGSADLQINGGTIAANAVTFSSQNNGDPISTLSFPFSIDGTTPDLSVSFIMDQGQGGSPAALFAFANGLEITAVPEPGTAALSMIGLLALVSMRRRVSRS